MSNCSEISSEHDCTPTSVGDLLNQDSNAQFPSPDRVFADTPEGLCLYMQNYKQNPCMTTTFIPPKVNVSSQTELSLPQDLPEPIQTLLKEYHVSSEVIDDAGSCNNDELDKLDAFKYVPWPFDDFGLPSPPISELSSEEPDDKGYEADIEEKAERKNSDSESE